MTERTVTITLTYGRNNSANIKTNEVPESLIMESLQTLVKGMANTLVKEAQESFSKNADLEKYLDARIKIDREKLKKLLKS